MEISKETLGFLKAHCPGVMTKLQNANASLSSKNWASSKTIEEQVKEEQAPCRECDGVHCGQPTRGFYPLIVQSNGKPHRAMRMCRVEEARRKQEKIDRLMKNSCLPPYLEGKTWSDFQVDSLDENFALDAGKAVASGQMDRGLYITGSKGTGKTMLAYLIAREKLQAGIPTMFVFVPELLSKFRDAIRNEHKEDPAKIARDADLLILDDIGAERATPWVAEQLMDLVNYRYSNRKQTIFTSNYSLDELAEHIAGSGDRVTGERISSRIMAMTVTIPLNGRDRRMG